MKFKKYKDVGIEVPLPVMDNDNMAEFWRWCVENNIDVKIKRRKGVMTPEARFFSIEDMQKDGWDDKLSEFTKKFIKKIIPKKLKNNGKCAVVENEEDAIAVILRWT